MRTFLKDNWFKIILVLIFIGITLVIAYYYLSYIPERDRDKRIDAAIAADQEKFDKEQKEKRDYIAKRKKDCFDIYDKEKENWNNVLGQEYDADYDVCYVIYRSQQGEWAGKNCKQYLPTTSTPVTDPMILRLMFNNYTDCSEKQFRKEF